MCDLCELKHITQWYMKTPTVVVLDCKDCHKPMVVLRRHTMDPTFDDKAIMLNSLAHVANHLYGKNKWKLRKEQRKIKDHLHWHAEPNEKTKPKV